MFPNWRFRAGAVGLALVLAMPALATCSKKSRRVVKKVEVVGGVSCIGVSPMGGPTAGGTTVTITGERFDPAALVLFDLSAATNVSVDPAGETITCASPPGAPGSVDVAVFDLDGTGCRFEAAFLYTGAPICPIVLDVTPVEGPESGGTPVTVTGADFVPPVRVRFDGLEATGVTTVSSTEVRCLTPPGFGTVDMEVENVGGCTGTLAQAFTYYSVSPTSCSATFGIATSMDGHYRCVSTTGGDVVRLQCLGRVTFDETTSVFLDGLPLNRTVISPCDIEIVTPPLAPGPHALEACGRSGCWRFDGAISATDCPYNVSGQIAVCGFLNGQEFDDRGGGDSRILMICGDWDFGELYRVTLGGGSVSPIAMSGPGELDFNAPSVVCPGVVDVTVEELNSGRSATMTRGFRYTPRPPNDPEVSSISPSSGPAAGNAPLTIFGNNFPANALVYIAGQPAGNLVISPTRIDCTTPPASGPGMTDVIVEDPSTGCQNVLECGYEYTP